MLDEVGLGDLRTDSAPLFVDVPANGPDGGRGVLCGWDDPLEPSKNPPLVVRMEHQDWAPAVAHDGLPEGRFWLGQMKNAPVRPHDLQRRRVYEGVPVRLADGNEWVMPTVRALPKRYGFARDGKIGGTVCPEYRDLCEKAEAIHAQLMEEGSRVFEIEGGWLFGVQALALNYRVNADIVDWLGLVRDECLLNFVGGPLELQVIRDVEEAQKKTGFVPTPAT